MKAARVGRLRRSRFQRAGPAAAVPLALRHHDGPDATPRRTSSLIRRPDANNNFQDVTIDCLGAPITGWQTVGGYQWTHLDLQTGDFKDVSTCSNGRHELTSAAPFGLGVWGWGTPQHRLVHRERVATRIPVA